MRIASIDEGGGRLRRSGSGFRRPVLLLLLFAVLLAFVGPREATADPVSPTVVAEVRPSPPSPPLDRPTSDCLSHPAVCGAVIVASPAVSPAVGAGRPGDGTVPRPASGPPLEHNPPPPKLPS